MLILWRHIAAMVLRQCENAILGKSSLRSEILPHTRSGLQLRLREKLIDRSSSLSRKPSGLFMVPRDQA
jgi:hypothetical protein